MPIFLHAGVKPSNISTMLITQFNTLLGAIFAHLNTKRNSQFKENYRQKYVKYTVEFEYTDMK